MKRLFCSTLFALMLGLLAAGSASATTYYIAANGSDSNSGTSQSSPWLHAPGMSTCTATCASTSIKPGDSIIFRGGDTWHFGNSSLSPFAGFKANAWNFTASGSAGSCQLNPAAGSIVTTSCIYIGVDQGWSSGSSWTRPVLNMDNPITTSSPSSCAYDDSNQNIIDFHGSYLVIDNFEIMGYCWNSSNPTEALVRISANDEMKNSYWHGWTMGKGASGCGSCDSDEYWAIGPVDFGSVNTYCRVDHNVFDGSDSTFGNLFGSYGDASGGIFYGGGEIDHNVVNHASNGVKYTSAYMFHDNYMNYLYEPVPGGTHGNVMELPGSGWNWNVDTYYYNNIVLNANIGETVDFYPGAAANGKAGFIFNNVMSNPDGHAGVNCYMLEGDGNPGPGMVYFFNNTSVAGCIMRNPGRGSNTVTLQNNHFIGYSVLGAITQFVSSLVTPTDDGNQIWASVSTVNSQGYTVGNNYAPTSSNCNGVSTSSCTIGAGANLTSICNKMDNAAAASACQNGIQGVSYNASNHTAVDNAVTPRGSSWDAGAYQFSTSSSGPVAPTGLAATVQ
jgi:hypothetical protein